MSKTHEREARIMDALMEEKKLSTEQVMSLLDISRSSARRFFLELEESGSVVRTLGGIQLVSVKELDYSFDDLESKNLDEKRQIACTAANLICEEDIVYFDGGTTLFQLAMVVRQKLQNRELQHIRVVTNSLANLQILNDCCDIILVGGSYRARRKDFAGYAAERFIQNFNYKKAFLGADGFDFSDGFMATDADTAKLNELVVKRSRESYVLMDSSKFGVQSFVSYARAADIKAVISDKNLDSAFEASCSQANLVVIRA